MMSKLRTLSLILSLLFVSILISHKANAQSNLFQNGSFETGDFTGWTVIQNINSGGDWFVYSGDLTPIFSDPFLPPPDGDFAAITDQGGPSSQVLYQDIDVPNGTVACSAIIYYVNRAVEDGDLGEGALVDGGVFVTGPDLSQLDGPNQQARIDIMDPESDPFDVGSGVLLNIFQTNPGDPSELNYTTIDFDLSDFAGSTVRFRAAEVDNLGNFFFAIDNVQCLVPTNIPTLSEWGMISVAFGFGLIGIFFVIRRKKAIS